MKTAGHKFPTSRQPPSRYSKELGRTSKDVAIYEVDDVWLLATRHTAADGTRDDNIYFIIHPNRRISITATSYRSTNVDILTTTITWIDMGVYTKSCTEEKDVT